MKVLLSDDHPMFREGLKAMLDKEEGYCVIGQASDGAETVELAGKLKPDIIVMDITMPVLTGLEATEQIRSFYPHMLVVILSRHADNIYVDKALKAGASAYVHKDAAYDELVMALNAVTKGRKYLSPAVLEPIVSRYLKTSSREGAMGLYDTLTDREKEVFQLMANNRTRSMIAETLNISPKTVDRHRSNLLKKLNLQTDEEILAFCKEVGLME
jgi:two-component system, NarL family, response regulator NreC